MIRGDYLRMICSGTDRSLERLALSSVPDQLEHRCHQSPDVRPRHQLADLMASIVLHQAA